MIGRNVKDWSAKKSIVRRFYKRKKARIERKKARRNPECVPTYGKYDGYAY